MSNVSDVSINEENPLKELLISESELNKGKLLEILKDFIRIDADTGQIIPISDYVNLSVWQQVLVFLLGAKALKTLKKRGKETLGPKEISEMSGINYNSVRSYLSQLENNKTISKVGSEYYVPNYNIEKIRLELINVGRKS